MGRCRLATCKPVLQTCRHGVGSSLLVALAASDRHPKEHEMTATRTNAEVAINEIVRDAIAGSTGARTNVERAGSSDDHWLGIDEEWAVVCVSHGEFVGVDSRKEAWLTSTHPELFCRLCGMIAAGKFHKITR